MLPRLFGAWPGTRTTVDKRCLIPGDATGLGVDTDEGYDEAEETLDDLSLEEDEVYDDSIKPEGLVDVVGEDDDF